MIQRVLQHLQLQVAVRYFLFPSCRISPIEEGDLDTQTLHPIPELSHLGWDRASGNCSGDMSVSVSQAKQILEVDTYAIARVGTRFPLFSVAPSLNEDV